MTKASLRSPARAFAVRQHNNYMEIKEASVKEPNLWSFWEAAPVLLNEPRHEKTCFSHMRTP